MLAYYGNKCICCGEIEPKFLTIDHVLNDHLDSVADLRLADICSKLLKASECLVNFVNSVQLGVLKWLVCTLGVTDLLQLRIECGSNFVNENDSTFDSLVIHVLNLFLRLDCKEHIED